MLRTTDGDGRGPRVRPGTWRATLMAPSAEVHLALEAEPAAVVGTVAPDEGPGQDGPTQDWPRTEFIQFKEAQRSAGSNTPQRVVSTTLTGGVTQAQMLQNGSGRLPGRSSRPGTGVSLHIWRTGAAPVQRFFSTTPTTEFACSSSPPSVPCQLRSQRQPPPWSQLLLESQGPGAIATTSRRHLALGAKTP